MRQDRGFTLVELLVVMIVVGVLAGIAIPTFLAQRETGHRTSATSDLRNTAALVTALSVEEGGTYSPFDGWDEDDLAAAGFRTGEWIRLDVTGDGTAYCVLAQHEGLPDEELRYSSVTGVVETGPVGSLSC